LIDDLKLEAISERELTVCAFESQSNWASVDLSDLIWREFGRIPRLPSLLTRALTRFRPSQLFHKTLRL
jgi:hypothetical protein